MTVPDDILPGDALLYRGSGFFDKVIALKTWCRAAVHCEAYVGSGQSVASRNGLGVNIYPMRMEGLSRVLRPVGGFDREAAQLWFYSKAIGQAYDWVALLSFYLAVNHGSPRKMFCSEFLTRWYRAGKFQPFNLDWDADTAAPATFLVPPPSVFLQVWSDGF